MPLQALPGGAGTDVVKAEVVDHTLTLQWCNGEWQRWEELQSSPELARLKTTTQEKLDRVKNMPGKGKKGKGQ